MSRHVDPRQAERLAERERIRAHMEARIAAWIELLDRFDGDPDLEPDLGFYMPGNAIDAEADTFLGASSDDEPSLGAPERHPSTSHWGGDIPLSHSQLDWAAGGDCRECEEENEHATHIDGGELDDSHDEPSLGAPLSHHDQTRWGDGDTQDLEGGDILDEPHDELWSEYDPYANIGIGGAP